MVISRKLMTVIAGLTLLLLFMGGTCTKGKAGANGAQGTPGAPGPVPITPTALLKGQSLPGVVIAVTSVTGATGAGGAFQVGDRPAVRFTVKKNDGAALNLSELNSAAIMFSGPTFNYQRVIASQSNLIIASVQNSDGSYTYTFATGILDQTVHVRVISALDQKRLAVKLFAQILRQGVVCL